MIVKLKENPPFEKYPNCNVLYLDKSTAYTVIAIKSPNYLLLDEGGDLTLHPMLFFDVIDSKIDDDWVLSVEDYGDEEYDIQVCFESKDLKGFNYEKFYDEDDETMQFFLKYLETRGIPIVSNLAYYPARIHLKYYKELLEKIDRQEKLS